MSYDLHVLRALVRISRRRLPATPDALSLRAGGTVEDVCRSLRRLSRAELVINSAHGPSLTMAGLAVAVASVPPPKSKSQVERVHAHAPVPRIGRVGKIGKAGRAPRRAA
jgi:hypothetical protein